jgi:hypothetical protein
MATLTDAEKIKIIRRAHEKAHAAGVPVRWVKAALLDVVQTIQDAVDGTINIQKAECAAGTGTGFNVIVSDRIDVTATTHGLTFTTAEKKWLFAFTMELTYERDK